MKKLKKGWRFNGNEINYLKDLLSKDFAAGDASTYNERLENLFAKKHLQKYVGVTGFPNIKVQLNKKHPIQYIIYHQMFLIMINYVIINYYM